MGSDLWQVTRDGLRELGYVEGQNLIIEFRSAEGRSERLPGLLAELIRPVMRSSSPPSRPPARFPSSWPR